MEGRNTYLSLDLKQVSTVLWKNIGIFGYWGFRISGFSDIGVFGYRGSWEFEDREFRF